MKGRHFKLNIFKIFKALAVFRSNDYLMYTYGLKSNFPFNNNINRDLIFLMLAHTFFLSYFRDYSNSFFFIQSPSTRTVALKDLKYKDNINFIITNRCFDSSICFNICFKFFI